MVTIRIANPSDIETLVSLDPLSRTNKRRIPFINQAVNSGTCHLLESNGRIVGYGVLSYAFYQYGFVELLYVHSDFRRKNLATRLMNHFEAICTTEKLFTSTNKSNIPMQRLLESIGYQPSGVIENLDENDPELVYIKRLAC